MYVYIHHGTHETCDKMCTYLSMYEHTYNTVHVDMSEFSLHIYTLYMNMHVNTHTCTLARTNTNLRREIRHDGSDEHTKVKNTRNLKH